MNPPNEPIVFLGLFLRLRSFSSSFVRLRSCLLRYRALRLFFRPPPRLRRLFDCLLWTRWLLRFCLFPSLSPLRLRCSPAWIRFRICQNFSKTRSRRFLRLFSSLLRRPLRSPFFLFLSISLFYLLSPLRRIDDTTECPVGRKEPVFVFRRGLLANAFRFSSAPFRRPGGGGFFARGLFGHSFGFSSGTTFHRIAGLRFRFDGPFRGGGGGSFLFALGFSNRRRRFVYGRIRSAGRRRARRGRRDRRRRSRGRRRARFRRHGRNRGFGFVSALARSFISSSSSFPDRVLVVPSSRLLVFVGPEKLGYFRFHLQPIFGQLVDGRAVQQGPNTLSARPSWTFRRCTTVSFRCNFRAIADPRNPEFSPI